MRKSFRERPVDLVDVRFVRQHRGWRPMLTIFAFFTLGGIALLALWNAAAHISFEALVAALGSLPFTSLVSALAATLVSYACLSVMIFWLCVMKDPCAASSLFSLRRAVAMPSATRSGLAPSRVGRFATGSIRQLACRQRKSHA